MAPQTRWACCKLPGDVGVRIRIKGRREDRPVCKLGRLEEILVVKTVIGEDVDLVVIPEFSSTAWTKCRTFRGKTRTLSVEPSPHNTSLNPNYNLWGLKVVTLNETELF